LFKLRMANYWRKREWLIMLQIKLSVKIDLFQLKKRTYKQV